ncbi:MAG: hypothetical protein NTW21_32940 [Verrucomicrobia bacterium]|nr:hypothetical protein [Verrucomicrobiota bacterium]
MKAARQFVCHPAFLVIALWLFPFVFLTYEMAAGNGRGVRWWVEQRAWQIAARHTLEQAGMVATIAFVAGWLPGVLTGLSPRGWRWPIQALCALPLLLPPFLWAIGWSFLQCRAPRAWYALFDGRWGMLCAGLAAAVPLVVLAASAAVSAVPRAQWEFCLTRCGKWRTRWVAARRAWPAAAGAAALAALLGTADAGAGQIMGWHGMAGDVLVSLATRQDLAEAATKALAGMVLLLPLAAVAAWLLVTAWAHRQTSQSVLRHGGMPDCIRLNWMPTMALALTALIALGLPAGGLATPLSKGRGEYYLLEAFVLWKSSLGPTLWYAVGGGAVATAGGAILAARCAGQARWIALFLLALAVPSSLRSLGWASAGAHWPVVRVLLSGEPGVAFVLGVQWMPLAALLLAPAFAAVPSSWNDRRRLTGMARLPYTLRVLLPVLAPWLGIAALSCALLVLADVTSLMLLQPPGRTAFTSHVFAVMDNSMEIIVASLCVALLLMPLMLGLLLLLATTATRWRISRFLNPLHLNAHPSLQRP